MTDCAQCGDCCDPVTLSAGQAERVFTDMFGPPAAGGQREWIRRHWHFVAFIGEHQLTPTWTTGPSVHLSCDYFDRVSRTCTAYDDRPAACRGYPFYGDAAKADSTMGGRCSFLADVPGIRMLPLVAVTGGNRSVA